MIFFLFGVTTYEHVVAEGDKGYIPEITEVHVLPFVYLGTSISGYLINAIIGLSVVCKALDNTGAFRCWFGVPLVTVVLPSEYGIEPTLRVDLSRYRQSSSPKYARKIMRGNYLAC